MKKATQNEKAAPTHEIDPSSATDPLPIGSLEPHAPLLTAPPPRQLLYKVMQIEHLLASIEGSYLHFNRVDSYKDFDSGDLHDGEQLPKDRPANTTTNFEKGPNFSIADYYDQSRSRTYACCFSLENSDYVWRNYGNGGAAGKVCLVFRFDKLREMLNNKFTSSEAAILYNGAPCYQIFSINYGIVDYIDWNTHRTNHERLPNPISYTFMKQKKFDKETEFRVSLSALGIGHFVLADGTKMNFPAQLRFAFDYRAAIAAEAIQAIEPSADCDSNSLQHELKRFGITAKG